MFLKVDFARIKNRFMELLKDKLFLSAVLVHLFWFFFGLGITLTILRNQNDFLVYYTVAEVFVNNINDLYNTTNYLWPFRYLPITAYLFAGGILLETPYSIEAGLIVLAASDRENDLFEVKGKLIHTTKASNGLYHSGIEFIGIDERVKAFITKLIKEYNYQGYNLFITIAKKINELKSSSLPQKITNT